MTRHSLQRRIATLQANRAPALARVIGWQDVGEPGIDEHTVELSTPGGASERMTLDEWRRHYPHGLLIRVVYGDEDGNRANPDYREQT